MAITVTQESLHKTEQGKEVILFRIKNGRGLTVSVMNFGVTLRELIVPDREGHPTDVLLGWNDPEMYKTQGGFLGGTIGPNCNRIRNSKYTIDGVTYTMKANEGSNNCHSDKEAGLDKRVWDHELMPDGVRFFISCPDEDLGFPGNREFIADVTIANLSCALMLTFQAFSDKNTLVNMTNHAYFNLGGPTSTSVLDHVVQLNAQSFTPIHADCIPTGEIKKVEKTPFDFMEAKEIGKDIDRDDKQLKMAEGYDHNFLIDRADGSLEKFATVTCKETGIVMEAMTTLPAFQFYTANHLQGENGKGGRTYEKRAGLCLESQYVPNAVNDNKFVSPIFGPEKPYRAQTCFRFMTESEYGGH